MLSSPKLKELSKRELIVIEKVLLGMPNKVIAKELYIAERTVKFHCSNIYRKIGAADRLSLFLMLKNTPSKNIQKDTKTVP